MLSAHLIQLVPSLDEVRRALQREHTHIFGHICHLDHCDSLWSLLKCKWKAELLSPKCPIYIFSGEKWFMGVYYSAPVKKCHSVSQKQFVTWSLLCKFGAINLFFFLRHFFKTKFISEWKFDVIPGCLRGKQGNWKHRSHREDWKHVEKKKENNV